MAGPQVLLALQSQPAATGIPIVLVESGAVTILGAGSPIVGTETIALALADVASALVASFAAPDQAAPALVDSASIAATLTPPADAFSPALDDHGSVVAMLASTDLLAAALAELAAVATEGGVVLV